MPDDPGESPQESKFISFWWVKCEGVCSLGRYSTQAGIFDFYGIRKERFELLADPREISINGIWLRPIRSTKMFILSVKIMMRLGTGGECAYAVDMK